MLKKQILSLLLFFFYYSGLSGSQVVVSNIFQGYQTSLEDFIKLEGPFSAYILPRLSYLDISNLLAVNKCINKTLLENDQNINQVIEKLYTEFPLYNQIRYVDQDKEDFSDYIQEIFKCKRMLYDVWDNLKESNFLVEVEDGLQSCQLYVMRDDINNNFKLSNKNSVFLKYLHNRVKNTRMLIFESNQLETSLQKFDTYKNSNNHLDNTLIVQFSDNFDKDFIKNLLQYKDLNICNVLDINERGVISFFGDLLYGSDQIDDNSQQEIEDLCLDIIKTLDENFFAFEELDRLFTVVCEKKDTDFIRFFLDSLAKSTLHFDSYGYGFFREAIFHSLFDIAEILLEQGLIVNRRRNGSIFSDCLENKNIEGIQFLLKNGFDPSANINISYLTKFKKNIFDCFVYDFENNMVLTNFFCENFFQEEPYFKIINECMTEDDLINLIIHNFTPKRYSYLQQFSCFNDPCKNKAFLFACMTNKKNDNQNMDIIKNLISSGVNIDEHLSHDIAKKNRELIGQQEYTSLNYACINEDIELLLYLLENNVDVYLSRYNYGNSLKYNIFEFACKKCSSAVVKVFLEHFQSNKEEFIKNNLKALFFACDRGVIDINLVKELLEYGFKPNILQILGDLEIHQEPLWLAAENGNKELVELLINYGADINTLKGWSSPLYIAATKSFIDVIELLLDNGACINQKNSSDENTPLIGACKKNQFNAVRYLLDRGANVLIKDKKGNDLQSLISNEQKERDEILRLIVQKRDEQSRLQQKIYRIKRDLKNNTHLINTMRAVCFANILLKQKYSEDFVSEYAQITRKKINIPVFIHILIKIFGLYYFLK